MELEPPAPRLRRLLADAGFELSEELAAAGFGAEIAYYLEHHLEVPIGLRSTTCATAVRRSFARRSGCPASTTPRPGGRCSRRSRISAFPDVAPCLRELRERGVVLVVVSNWDCSLPGWLDSAGMLELVDAVVSSAAAGAAKPAPAVFERALELAGVAAADALHVGDSLDNDVAGARAAGIRPLLIVREGRRRWAWRRSGRWRSWRPPLICVESAVTPASASGASGGRPPALALVVRAARLRGRRGCGAHQRRGGLGAAGRGRPGRVLGRDHRGDVPARRLARGGGAAVRLVRAPAARLALRPAPHPVLAAVGWAALGIFAFYVFAAVYTVTVNPDVDQTVAEDLGAGESNFGLIAAGFMIICVAPFAEEFFFRGFFYGALVALLGGRGGDHRRGAVRA